MEAAVDETRFEMKALDADEDQSASMIDAAEIIDLIDEAEDPLDIEDRDEDELEPEEDGPSSPSSSVEIINLVSQETEDVTPAEQAMAEEPDSPQEQTASEEPVSASGNSERTAKRRATTPPEPIAPQPRKKPASNAAKDAAASGTSNSTASASAATDDSNGGPAAKKRRFAAIKKSEKCGKCDNCRNPHWKKACSEARKAQEEAPNSGKTKTSTNTTTAAAAATASHPPSRSDQGPVSEDRFTSSMGKIMASGGGIVHTNHVPVLIDLMKRAGSWGQRTAVLLALVRSSSEVQKEVVHQKGLLTLQKWFSEAVEAKREKTLQNLMRALDALPMTLAALSPPCELGKLVGKLRKAEGLEAVRPQAQSLVTKWKAIVEQSNNSAPIAQAAAVAATAAAKAKATSAASEAKISAAAEKTKAAAPSTAGVSSSSIGPPTGSIAAAAAAAVPGTNGTKKRALGEDGDIFGIADKKRADAVVRQQRTEPSKKPEGTTTTAPKTSTSMLSSNPRPSVIGTARKANSEPGSGRTTSSSLLTSSSLGSTMSAPPPLLTGAERARQRARDAAARVPSPEPRPRTEKRKKVSWGGADSLEAVRWFRRADPPSAAQRDVDESTPAAAPPSPPRFASAAKKEHLSEALALKAHREQEDHEQAEFRERLDVMRTEVYWYDPPLIAAAVDAHLAAGEQSTERAAAIARRAHYPPAVYLTAEAVPPTPAEPAEPADRGYFQPLHYIPRIPLSTDEARAWQAAAAAPTIPQPQETYYPQQQQPQQQAPPVQHHHQQQYGAFPPGYQSSPPTVSAPPPQHHDLYGGYSGGGGGYDSHYRAPAPAQHHQPQHPVTMPMTTTHVQPPPLGMLPPMQQQAPVAPQATLPTLPLDLSAAIAQLAASGALNNVTQQSAVPQAVSVPKQQHQHQPQQQQHHPHRHHQHKEHRHQPPQQQQQQPQQRPAAPRNQPRAVLPPGLRPMLGLHRPAQAAPPPQQQQQQNPPHQAPPPVVHPGNGKVLPSFRSSTPCRFFNTAEGCRLGDSCRFAHVPGEHGPRRPRY